MIEMKRKLADEKAKSTIRARTREDTDAVLAFYRKLTEEDQELASIDSLDRETVAERFAEVSAAGGDRLIAVRDDAGEVIAEAILERMRLEWMRKTGEIRFLILPDFRAPSLARTLAQEIFLLAARRGLNHLIVRLMDNERAMLDIFREMRFIPEAIQKKHAYDRAGSPHDVHVLTFSLRKMWRSLEELVRGADSFTLEH